MEGYELTRFCFLRGIGFIYLMGFLNIINQYRALLGDRGLMSARRFANEVPFRAAPSIFHWIPCSDRWIALFGWFGVVLATLATVGLSDAYGFPLYLFTWILLWIIYQSFVNIGQTFYGFGWESILLETGFLTIFLGPSSVQAPVILIWLLRWVLFRVMFGAGLIKLRGDPCWRDLTCMYYHYETQPIPNPFSWYFHHLPKIVHKSGVLYNYFVELIVPFAFFLPVPFSTAAGLLTVLFQVILIFSGNLSWLNYLTLVLCIPCFDDAFLSSFTPLQLPEAGPITIPYLIIIVLLTGLIAVLSIRPTLNLFSVGQRMNATFDSLHLVNTYGAFGSIGKERNEVIIQGTDDDPTDPAAHWQEYEFKGKPGNVGRRPCFMSPYHYRLDWQIWFAAMSSQFFNPWVITLVTRLLQGEPATLKLLAKNPFSESPPKFVRAELYRYRFTKPGESAKDWWHRTRIANYLPPLSLTTNRAGTTQEHS